jgi:hypothetical protein
MYPINRLYVEDPTNIKYYGDIEFYKWLYMQNDPKLAVFAELVHAPKLNDSIEKMRAKVKDLDTISIDNFKKLTFEWFIKIYFEKNILIIKNINIKAFILYDLHIRKTMILNKKNVWELAEPSDEIEIDESKEGKEKLIFNIDNYLNKETSNGIIGFIGFKKKSKILMFKTKDVLLPRDTGASCIESGKSKTLVVINKIIGKETYNKENTKIIKDEDGNIIQEAVSESELCVLQEFILRKYNKDKKLGKLWFLTPDMAIHFGIYNPKI